MDYKEFTGIMEEKIQENMGNGVRIRRTEVLKNNGVKKDGLTLSHETASVSPVIYLSDMYQIYQDGGSIEECTGLAAEALQKILRERDAAERFAGGLQSWESCRDNLYPILLNRKANEELLKNLVYRPYLDLAICYSLCLDEAAAGTASTKVCRRMTGLWGITEEELHDQAIRNMENAGYRLEGMWDILKEMMPVGENDAAGIPNMYMILTNRSKLFGAVGILKTGLLDEFAEEAGRNLFLIPSSIHEILILPDDGKITVQELNEMISSVNEEQLQPEEILSDHAYYYDRENREVRIAE